MSEPSGSGGTKAWWFHFTEFTATFFFAVLQIFVIMYSPRSLDVLYDRSKVGFLKVVIFANLIASLVPALMVMMDLNRFDQISHEIEYTGGITLAFLDLIMLRNTLELRKTQVYTGRRDSVDGTIKMVNSKNSSGPTKNAGLTEPLLPDPVTPEVVVAAAILEEGGIDGRSG